MGMDGWRPNGLPFSCRERARGSPSKPNDLAREAVNWNGVLGCYVSPFIGEISPMVEVLLLRMHKLIEHRMSRQLSIHLMKKGLT
jgi:hypothetical protein